MSQGVGELFWDGFGRLSGRFWGALGGFCALLRGFVAQGLRLARHQVGVGGDNFRVCEAGAALMRSSPVSESFSERPSRAARWAGEALARSAAYLGLISRRSVVSSRVRGWLKSRRSWSEVERGMSMVSSLRSA